jgi:hypothetical protein
LEELAALAQVHPVHLARHFRSRYRCFFNATTQLSLAPVSFRSRKRAHTDEQGVHNGQANE